MPCLDVTVRFLDGRYHGDPKEWPPAPMRLFQALVHGSKIGAAAKSWTLAHDRALEWLSGLEPPEILCRRSTPGRSYMLFVPNNSLGKDYRNTKTAKRAKPTLFERHRAGDHDVVYRWQTPDVEAARTHLSALDQLSSHLLALGWGIDIAVATAELAEGILRPTPELERFVPAAQGGRVLRTLRPGLLHNLEESHHAALKRITPHGVNPYTRPQGFALTRYRKAVESSSRRWIAFGLETPDGEPFGAPWAQTSIVSAWIRHMAGEAMTEELFPAPGQPPSPKDQAWLDSYILGHTDTTRKGHRLSYIPLPTVGHRHSDGGVRRALVVEAPTADSFDASALDLLQVKAPGRFLRAEPAGSPRAALVPLEDRTKVLPYYVNTARVWRSVTPVVLHGHNTERRRISISKTERLLYQAFEAADYPAGLIRELGFQTAPYWPGCEASSAMQVPRHLSTWPRLHVYVEFAQSVTGPIAIGLGRHYGIGVFARVPSQD